MSKTTAAIVAAVAGIAAIAGVAGAAGAADLNRGGMKDSYMPAYFGQPTWYGRIDGAWGMHDAPIMTVDGTEDLVRTDIAGTWGLGGGIGRYFTPSIRGDITYDHRFDTDVKGTSPNFTNGRTALTSDVVLLNLYYDFDNRSRFTPYVGLGLGVVHHDVAAGSAVQGNVAGASNWHVAGAFMAGVSLAMTQRLHLDAGYRFLYLGEAATGNSNATNPGFVVSKATIEDIHAHELRFGLRYDIR